MTAKLKPRDALHGPDFEHLYPFDRDETHRGRMARIPGRTGQFKVWAHETNPRTGASWWQLIGPQTPGDPGQWVHVREITLIPERKTRSPK